MNVLLTNDDGYEAPGLKAAFEAVRHLGKVHVIAPVAERSSCSHSITTGRPISVQVLKHETFGKMYAVDGTPADCVRVADGGLLSERVDLVVSGVNRGANAGVDVYYSGTIAGAREAALLGHLGIAVSQATRPEVQPDWEAVAEVTRLLVDQLLKESLPGSGFWSINYPAPLPDEPAKHVHRVSLAERSWPIRFERHEMNGHDVMQFQYAVPYWRREVTERSDYTVIRDGGIAVSAVPLFCRF